MPSSPCFEPSLVTSTSMKLNRQATNDYCRKLESQPIIYFRQIASLGPSSFSPTSSSSSSSSSTCSLPSSTTPTARSRRRSQLRRMILKWPTISREVTTTCWARSHQSKYGWILDIFKIVLSIRQEISHFISDDPTGIASAGDYKLYGPQVGKRSKIIDIENALKLANADGVVTYDEIRQNLKKWEFKRFSFRKQSFINL